MCLDLPDRVDVDVALKVASSYALTHFIIPKFPNIFVYREKSNKIFYMKLFGKSVAGTTGDLLPSSSDTDSDMNGSFSEKEVCEVSPKPNIRNSHADKETKKRHVMIMRVFGVDQPGEEITIHLRLLLQRKLEEYLLSTLSQNLLRNPKLRLTTGYTGMIL